MSKKSCFNSAGEGVVADIGAGTGKLTENLNENSVHWALIGSSLRWADSRQAVREFYRILVPGGFFTAIWNPRDIEISDLHQRLEEAVYSELPKVKRVSSGRTVITEEMRDKLLSGGYFRDILFMEAPYVEIMSKERYMNI